MKYSMVVFLSIFLIVGALAGSAPGVDLNENEYYEREENDFVQLQVLDDKVTAFRSRNPSTPVRLDVGEKILIQKEDGNVGAVVTNTRFLAVSAGSNSWLSESLHTGEGDSAELMVGKEIAMMVTGQRIIGYSAGVDRIFTYPLSVGDNVMAKDVGQRVGVVVLPDRAVGFSATSAGFSTVRFDYGGAFRSLETAAAMALVETDNRIYAYRAAGGTWSVQDIPPGE